MADDAGDRRPETNTPEFFANNRRRHGHPLGARRSSAEPDDAMQALPFHPRADVSDLVDLLHGMGGKNPPPPEPPKAAWMSAPVVIGAIVSLMTIAGGVWTGVTTISDFRSAVMQGQTQLGDRLSSFGDRMLSHDSRIGDLEKYQREGSADRAQIRAYNSVQDERFQNLTKALEQERQARIDSEADIRRAEADLRAQGSELSKVLSELRSDVKVLVDRAQRPHAAIETPQRDAQVVPGR